MSKELKEYIDQIKQDLEKSEEKEILLHRLYYLTGQQIFESIEEVLENENIIDLIKKSFVTIQEGSNKQMIEPTSKTLEGENSLKNIESKLPTTKASALDEQEKTTAKTSALDDQVETTTKTSALDEQEKTTAKTSALDDQVETTTKTSALDEQVETTAKTSALDEQVETTAKTSAEDISEDTSKLPASVRLALSVRKEDFRYRINEHDFVFASLPLQRFFAEAVSKQFGFTQQEHLAKEVSSLAYSQLDFCFQEKSTHFSIGQKIETGLLLFKKLGWGNFHFLVQQSPHLIAVENDFIDDADFLAATLNGIFSYAYGFNNEQSFVISQVAKEELSTSYNELKDNSLFFWVKDKL